MKFIKMHAMEIYTVIAFAFIVWAIMRGDLSSIQKLVLAYCVLFVMHEWEEGRFPGGFLHLIADNILCREVPEETLKGSRIPAGILLLSLTFVPFVFDNHVIPILVTASLGLFEGIVHIAFIKVMALEKPYSPGMVTAEMECILSICVFIWLGRNGMTTGLDYVLGVVILLFCYMLLQRTLFAMVGVPYSELPKLMKARIKVLKEMK